MITLTRRHSTSRLTSALATLVVGATLATGQVGEARAETMGSSHPRALQASPAPALGPVSATARHQADAARWRAAWGTALHATSANSEWQAHPTPAGATLADATYRFVVSPTVTGHRLRIRLANWLNYGLAVSGLQPVTFDAVSVATRRGESGAAVVAGTVRPVTFGGQRQLTLRANESRHSDPVDLAVASGDAVVVSIHTPAAHLTPPAHAQTFVTQYATAAGAGDHTADVSGDAFTQKQEPIFWLDAVDVESTARHSIVAIGDSITDGDHCGDRKDDGTCAYNDDNFMDRVSTYPGFLARRTAHLAPRRQAGIVNKGVNGAISLQSRAVLRDDVLLQSGVTAVIVEVGTNDLTLGTPVAAVKANLRSMARTLHRHGMWVIGATLVPRADMSGGSAVADRGRARLNTWIRTSGEFDQVLDIAAVVGMGADDNTFRPRFDSGDHLHPNAAGQRAIARALSLAFLD